MVIRTVSSHGVILRGAHYCTSVRKPGVSGVPPAEMRKADRLIVIYLLTRAFNSDAWKVGEPCKAGCVPASFMVLASDCLQRLWLEVADGCHSNRFEPYPSNTSLCQPCSAGRYKDATGSHACTSCPSNSLSGMKTTRFKMMVITDVKR